MFFTTKLIIQLVWSIATLVHSSSGHSLLPRATKTIDDIFDLKPSGNDVDGVCSADQREWLNNWLADSQEVVQAAVQSLKEMRDGANTKGAIVAREYAQSWFKVFFYPDNGRSGDKARKPFEEASNIAQVNALIARFTRMQDFLDGSITGANTAVKTILFCGSEWLEESETLFQADGQPAKDDRGDIRTIRTLKTEEISNIITAKFLDIAMIAQRPTSGGLYKAYAFWSKDLKLYQWYHAADRPKEVNGRRHTCNNIKDVIEAVANDGSNKQYATITICPIMFDKPAKRIRLSDVLGNSFVYAPESGRSRGVLGTRLDDILPGFVTLLHELFHVTEGGENTDDLNFYQSRGILQALKSNNVNPLNLPEVLAYFAFANWHSLKMTTPCKWSNMYCTFWKDVSSS